MNNRVASQSCRKSRRLHLGFLYLGAPFAGCAVLMLFLGCERQPSVKSSITLLEKAFPAASVSAPGERAPSGQPQNVDATFYVQLALSAARSNDYATAVILLKTSARVPGLTPEQFLLTQQTKQALLTDLQKRAAKNDAGAQAALQTIEQSNVH